MTIERPAVVFISICEGPRLAGGRGSLPVLARLVRSLARGCAGLHDHCEPSPLVVGLQVQPTAGVVDVDLLQNLRR